MHCVWRGNMDDVIAALRDRTPAGPPSLSARSESDLEAIETNEAAASRPFFVKSDFATELEWLLPCLLLRTLRALLECE